MDSVVAALDAFEGSDFRADTWLQALANSGAAGQGYADSLSRAWVEFPWDSQPSDGDGAYHATLAATVMLLVCLLLTAAKARTLFAQLGAQKLASMEAEFRSRFVRDAMGWQWLPANLLEEMLSDAQRAEHWLQGAQGMTDAPGVGTFGIWADQKYQPYREVAQGTLLILLSDQTGWLWRILPPRAKVLYARTTLQLVGEQNSALALDALAEFMTGWTQGGVSAFEASYPPQSQDGGEKNAIRLLRRVQSLTCIASSALKALSQVEAWAARQPDAELMDHDTVVEPPALNISDLSAMAMALIGDISEAHGWSFVPPGASRATLASKSDGLRFLASQTRDNYSVYKMPAFEAPQLEWEYWFRLIGNLEQQYEGLSAQLIVANITSNIQVDDRRWAGWQEKVLAMTQLGKAYTLQEFLSYIRKQVIHVQQTRLAAARELSALCKDCSSVVDLVGLATRLNQLFAQIYPAITEEVEPVPRRVAVNMVLTYFVRILDGPRGNPRS